MKKILTLLFIAVGLIPSVTLSNQAATPPPVTIWIHGTKMDTLAPIPMNDSGPLGLHKLQELYPEEPQRRLLEELVRSDPTNFPSETFYNFGWNGELDFKERRKTAQMLYEEILSLTRHYFTRYGAQPRITLITHSHGGNVALNLAQCLDPEQELLFTIDRLVLLACPIQEKTQAFISHPMFHKKYNIHSHLDPIQIIDPQSLHELKHIPDLFIKKSFKKAMHEFIETTNKKLHKNTTKTPALSERHFKNTAVVKHINMSWNNTVPWNTYDLSIFENNTGLQFFYASVNKMLGTNRGLMHIEFIIPSFVKHIPSIIAQADAIECNLDQDSNISL